MIFKNRKAALARAVSAEDAAVEKDKRSENLVRAVPAEDAVKPPLFRQTLQARAVAEGADTF